MDLVARVKGILLDPKLEWPKIAVEPATLQTVYANWVMLLAALGPLVILLSSAMYSGGFGFEVGLRAALAAYVTALVGVAVLAAVVDAIAPSFGGTRDYVRSLKLVAYSLTAVWVAGLALIVPVLGLVVVLIGAIYSAYLFMLGAPLLGRCDVDRAVPYTLIVVLCAIVLSILIRSIIFSLAGFSRMGPGYVGMMGMMR